MPSKLEVFYVIINYYLLLLQITITPCTKEHIICSHSSLHRPTDSKTKERLKIKTYTLLTLQGYKHTDVANICITASVIAVLYRVTPHLEPSPSPRGPIYKCLSLSLNLTSLITTLLIV